MKRLVLGSALFCIAFLVFSVEPTNAGLLYVGNSNGNNITRFDASGTPTLFATTGVKGPQDVAFDRSGNLYESNYTLNTVGRFAPDGTYLGVFASVGLSGPSGLAFDSHGNLFISSAGGRTIREVSPSGVDLGVFASGLNAPTGLAFDKSDNLYVGIYDPNHLGVVREFSHSGTDLGVFASAGLQTPFSLAFDKSGNLYVGDLNANAVHRFSPTGGDLGVLTSGTSGDVGGGGIALDSAGNIYVTNYRGFAGGTDTIRKFSRAGVDLGNFATTGLNNPTGMVFAPAASAVPEPSSLTLATSVLLVSLGYRLVRPLRRRVAMETT